MVDINRIINLRYNRVKPADGKILISEPFQNDKYFGRSVVILIDHSEEGTAGIVINKPLNKKVSIMINEKKLPEMRLFQGGPVATNQLFFLHSLGEVIPGSIDLGNKIYWGGSVEMAQELIHLNILNDENARFFLGYAGWSKHQLNEELKRDSWLVGTIDGETLFNTESKKLWEKSIEQLGGDYKRWLKLPSDPTMN